MVGRKQQLRLEAHLSTCADHRGRSTRSERPQNQQRNHPRPPLLETTRIDGVKAPLHDGTPRSHLALGGRPRRPGSHHTKNLFASPSRDQNRTFGSITSYTVATWRSRRRKRRLRARTLYLRGPTAGRHPCRPPDRHRAAGSNSGKMMMKLIVGRRRSGAAARPGR